MEKNEEASVGNVGREEECICEGPEVGKPVNWSAEGGGSFGTWGE